MQLINGSFFYCYRCFAAVNFIDAVNSKFIYIFKGFF